MNTHNQIAHTVMDNVDFDRKAAIEKCNEHIEILDGDDKKLWVEVRNEILRTYTDNKVGQKSVKRVEPIKRTIDERKRLKSNYKNGRNYENNIVQRIARSYSESEAVHFLTNNNRELRIVIGVLESDIEELKHTIDSNKQTIKELNEKLRNIEKPFLTKEERDIEAMRKMVSVMQSRMECPSAKTILMFEQRINQLFGMGLKQIGNSFVGKEGTKLIHMDELKLASDFSWLKLMEYAENKNSEYEQS